VVDLGGNRLGCCDDLRPDRRLGQIPPRLGPHRVPVPYPDQDRPRPQLDAAAPDVWIELSPVDAHELDVAEGDIVRLESARGRIEGRARVSSLRPGVVFVPFHYGDWDLLDEGKRGHRTANELTITYWDPVSKQPMFKLAAVRATKVSSGDGAPAPAPTTGAAAPLDQHVPPTTGGRAAEADSVVLSAPEE
jgi:ferredoxin-nitrate reductase